MMLSWLRKRRALPRRHLIRVEILATSVGGVAFENDARFDLFVDGQCAGYSLTPSQVKVQIKERLDIDMRRLAGFAPPSR